MERFDVIDRVDQIGNYMDALINIVVGNNVDQSPQDVASMLILVHKEVRALSDDLKPP